MSKKMLMRTPAFCIFMLFVSAGVISAFIIGLTNGFNPVDSRALLHVYGNGEKQPNDMILDQDHLIVEMIREISESNIHDTVYTLQNFTTRYYGTPGNMAAANWLFDKLDDIPRLTVEYQGGEELRNIIATLPGLDGNSTRIYLVGAHYDTVDLSFAPGATDNGGGVAIVLELARVMSSYEFNHTLVFALWNKEEQTSDPGSQSFVDHATMNNLDIGLYFNYDSSCYDPDDRFILDIMYNDQSGWAKDMMSRHNSLYDVGFNLTYNIHKCTSDHKSFWKDGYPAVMTHEEHHGPAHSSYDTIDKVNTLYTKKNAQLGITVLSSLSEVLQEVTVNQPPHIPSNPSPTDRSVDVELISQLSWSSSDPDGDNLTYDIYLEIDDASPDISVSSHQLETVFNPGTLQSGTNYYWQIIAYDDYGISTKGPVWSFTTITPNTPYNPSPGEGTTNVDINVVLTWTISNSEENQLTYDIHFGTRNPPPLKEAGCTTNIYDPGPMYYNTKYYWSITTINKENITTNGPIWSFTTKTRTAGNEGSGSVGGEGNEQTTTIPQNKKPIADSSAGEPYLGLVNSEIVFDGSSSNDLDGNITRWFWEFGDNTNDTGKIVKHNYSKIGTYAIKLTVTDNAGATNTDTTTCTISQPNRPPSKPTLIVASTGVTNTVYQYTATSTDPDNDMIKYTFNLSGTGSRSSKFLPSRTSFSINHSWTKPGQYNLTVTVTDNQTEISSHLIINITPAEKESQETPGFETMFIILAIASIIIWKRKVKTRFQGNKKD